MLSLHDLRAPAVALDWHEAVAVVAALTGLLIDAWAEVCPAPADVALLPSGELRVSGPSHLTGAPAAAVAGVLGQLLDTAPCPAELRQLARTYATDDRTGPAGQDALVALLAELAFYERPGRQAVLATLADRAETTLERTRRTDALEALTERTRVAAGASPRPSPVDTVAPGELAAVTWETMPDSPWRLAVPAAAAIMVFVGMAYLAASWFGDRTAPPHRRAAAVEEELPISGPGGVPETVASMKPAAVRPPTSPTSPGANAAPGSAAAAQTVAGPAALAPAATRPPNAPSSRAAAGASGRSPAGPAASTPALAPAVAPSKRGAVDVAISEREGRVVPSPIAPERPTSGPAPGGRVFSSSDAQVTPAILIRPRLPEQPPADVPEEQVGTLEFVVTESGAVEHVHLIAPANRYQERMLVAAAKTWQFQPATRDGQPVRFRIRIRVTL